MWGETFFHFTPQAVVAEAPLSLRGWQAATVSPSPSPQSLPQRRLPQRRVELAFRIDTKPSFALRVRTGFSVISQNFLKPNEQTPNFLVGESQGYQRYRKALNLAYPVAPLAGLQTFLKIPIESLAGFRGLGRAPVGRPHPRGEKAAATRLPGKVHRKRDREALGRGKLQVIGQARRSLHTQFSIAGTTPDVSQR